MLDGFIKKFVLCPECENPETELVSLSEEKLLIFFCGQSFDITTCMFLRRQSKLNCKQVV